MRFPFFEKKALRRSINEDMEKLSRELLLRPDRSLVRYQTPQEEILHAKERAYKYKIAGGASFAAAVIIIGTPIAFVPGLAALSLGLYGGTRLWRNGSSLLEEPEIRENLNKIMGDALNAYDKGNYQAFFEHLSKEYDKNGTRLVKLEKRGDSIKPENIIDSLLIHGFRSDGIAYLLNLLGEVLNSGKIEIKGKTGKIEITTTELKGLAKYVFVGVLSEKLKEEAKKLDERVNNLRSKFSKLYQTWDFFSFKEYSEIAQLHINGQEMLLQSRLEKMCDIAQVHINDAQEISFQSRLEEMCDIAQVHINDAQEMPFQSRLGEMCNIARINLSIFDILNGGQQEIDRAKETIKEIRNLISCEHQFVGMAKSRLEALEDLL